MKRLLLINTNTETRPYPVPPMGLCLVANSISDKYEVLIYDGTFQKNAGLNKCLQDFKPDYVGFSLRNIDDMVWEKCTHYIEDVYNEFISPVKNFTDVPTIIGGSGFSIFPNELLEFYDIDYGIVGAGEKVLPQLLDALDKGNKNAHLPRLISLSANIAVTGVPVHDQHDYTQSFSNVDRWIDFGRYLPQGNYPIQTKRGCGFKCIYCTYPGIEGCGYTLRRPRLVVDEMEEALSRLDKVSFEFVDSVFNDPAGHAEAICREIIARGLKLRMRTMGINPANCSRELLELMMQAGFTQIDSTPDSASPTMIRALQKNFTLPQLINTANLIREYNLPTMWFFVFGGPGETRETINETFSFIDKYINPADMVHVTAGLRIYPGTALYHVALKEGIISKDASLLAPKFYHTRFIPAEELKAILKEQCAARPNCILSSETTPPKEMMAEALRIRKEQNIDEPMFRTLLRLHTEGFDGKR